MEEEKLETLTRDKSTWCQMGVARTNGGRGCFIRETIWSIGNRIDILKEHKTVVRYSKRSMDRKQPRPQKIGIRYLPLFLASQYSFILGGCVRSCNRVFLARPSTRCKGRKNLLAPEFAYRLSECNGCTKGFSTLYQQCWWLQERTEKSCCGVPFCILHSTLHWNHILPKLKTIFDVPLPPLDGP